jgi:hypothetical protein
MPKIEEPPRYRVSKISIKDCYAEDIEKWMNDVNRDYVIDQTIQQGDDLVMILRYWAPRRVRRRPVTATVAKKKAAKKEADKK